MSDSNIDIDFLESVAGILEKARVNAKAAVDLSMVYSNNQIGQTLSDQLEYLPTISTGRKFALKRDALVELTLPEDSNIYASKYELYLPDKKLLQKNWKNGRERKAVYQNETAI